MDAPIVDSHLHLYRSQREGQRAKENYTIWEYGRLDRVRYSNLSGDVESALGALRSAQAQIGIVVNLIDVLEPTTPPSEQLIASNDWVCEVGRTHPALVPFLAVDLTYLPLDKTLAHIRELVDARGARGIKLHPPMQNLDLGAHKNRPLFELCRELDLPIISHSGPSRAGVQFGEPNAYRPLLDALPELRISLAHLGGAAWKQVPELARDYPGIHFDLSEVISWTGAPHAPSAEEIVTLIRAIGVERVMFGTDFPWYDIDYTVRQVRDLPGLSAAEQDAILGLNALQFFRLSLPAQAE